MISRLSVRVLIILSLSIISVVAIYNFNKVGFKADIKNMIFDIKLDK